MANMFRCTLASGGALILTVTCDSAFAGQTITCTDGTTTLTQICPSTSPYTVEFRIPNSGTWTISSGTDSTSVVIPDAIELHSIPEGSTVLPTDNIQTWLHCANIWDKTYTTISQILSDASTLQALISSNNAADYMARSTTWANGVVADSSAMSYIGLNNYCANKLLADATWLNAICNSTYFEFVLNIKIPTMTGYTTPSGQASASSEFHWDSTHMYAWKAFDGNNSTAWVGGTANFFRLIYKFNAPVTINKIELSVNSESGRRFTGFVIQGSNDETNWTDIYTNTTFNSTSGSFSHEIENDSEYQYYSIYITKSGATLDSSPGIKTMQLYGRS